jgi:K+-sensing histidine kinase KdpD
VAATGENWQSDETLYSDGNIMGAFSVYAFRISPGTMVAMFRDVTETRRAAFSLEQARKKMSLLNTVTFQDIQSAAFSLTAYHVLIDQINPDKKISAYLEKEKVLIQKIVTSLNFAKDYQDMGMHSPRWQSVSQTFLFAISHLDFLKIAHNLEVANLEIYADPLLEKVFFNLMENVLRHGDTACRVRLYCQEKTDELVLFVEDNGIGIPQEEKQMIFDRGHGKDTGLGLFLVREILSITGMSVRETGMYGQGTRFEIHIPQGAYRFNPPA